MFANQAFIFRVQHLTSDGSKAFLVFDACRAHLSILCLSILCNGGVEANAIPAHTSGTTQTLELSLYSPCRQYLYKAFHRLMNLSRAAAVRDGGLAKMLSIFEFCSVFRVAYESSFMKANTLSGLLDSVLWPCSPEKLLSRPLPACEEETGRIITVHELRKMLEDMRRRYRRRARDADIVVKRENVSMKSGSLLTIDRVLETTAKLERERKLESFRAAETVARNEVKN